MRVTDSIITRNLLSAVTRNRENMGQIQQEMSTGKRILKPSSDPHDYLLGQRFSETIAKNTQFIQNINNSRDWMDNSIQILTQIEDQISSAREIGVQGADLTNSSQREQLAERLEGIISDTVSQANSKYQDKYVYGGSLTKGDNPFVYDGTSVTYQGNTDTLTRRISENQNMEINVDGQTLADTGVFQGLIDLRNALQANDQDGIQTALGTLEENQKQFTNLVAAQGALINQLDLTQQRLETANTNLRSNLSETEDTDMLDAIVRYNQEELAYKAALQTTSGTLKMNLLDYI